MKKFKGMLATMLAVVLAVAAVVVYAPTEAYAANTYTCTWRVKTTDVDGEAGYEDHGLTGKSSFVFKNGDTMSIYIESDSGSFDRTYEVYYCYEDSDKQIDYSYGTLLGNGGKTTVKENVTYSDISGAFSSSSYKSPKNIQVNITKKFSDNKKVGLIYVIFSDAGDDSSDTASASSVNTASHTHTWKYGMIFDATEDTDGLEGYYCSCGANKETTIIPSITAIYKNRYTQMDQAGKGEVITLKMGEWNTYSKEFMQHLISATERGVTVKLDYKYEKKNYVTTVPAGTTMDLAYDYYGPLFIQSLFETTKLN